MAQAGPAAAIGAAENLTRFDLSDEENVKQALFELRRCATDFDYARWARLWGEAAMTRLIDAEAFDSDLYVSKDDHDETSADLEFAEKTLDALREAADGAVKQIDSALDGSKGPKTDAIGEITAKLEEAILASREERE